MIIIIFIIVGVALGIYFVKIKDNKDTENVTGIYSNTIVLDDADSLCEKGWNLYCGIGIEKNIHKAVDYMEQAAKLNNEVAKSLYAVMYYNLGESYGINKSFAESCMLDTVYKVDDVKFIVAEIIYNDLTEKKISKFTKNDILYKSMMEQIPSAFSEEDIYDTELFASCLVGLHYCCDCFAGSRKQESTTTYGEKAKELIKSFMKIIEAEQYRMGAANNKITNLKEEVEKNMYKIISDEFNEYSNKELLLKELGY